MPKQKYGKKPGHLFNDETSGCNPFIVLASVVSVGALMFRVFFS